MTIMLSILYPKYQHPTIQSVCFVVIISFIFQY